MTLGKFLAFYVPLYEKVTVSFGNKRVTGTRISLGEMLHSDVFDLNVKTVESMRDDGLWLEVEKP